MTQAVTALLRFASEDGSFPIRVLLLSVGPELTDACLATGSIFRCSNEFACPGGAAGTCQQGRDVDSVACYNCLHGKKPMQPGCQFSVKHVFFRCSHRVSMGESWLTTWYDQTLAIDEWWIMVNVLFVFFPAWINMISNRSHQITISHGDFSSVSVWWCLM